MKTDFSQVNIIDSAEKQASYLIVTENGKHLKVSPTSYFLLQSFNRGLSPQEIADTLNQQQNSKIPVEKIIAAYEDLLSKIKQLDSDRNLRRSGFWFLWEIIPSSVVNRIAKHFSLMFHPVIFGLAFILIFAGILINIRADTLSNSVSAIQSPGDLWIGYLLFLFSIIAHEFGHAAASAKYGAAPSGIGFTIYLVFPAFYSDVTSSWKLKSRQRAIVGLGGMYFQLLVAAYYTILNSIAAAGFFKVAISMIFINCLLNLNPFFKFDGFWILSDLLGVVNLSRQPKRFALFLYHRLRKAETPSLPWSGWVSALVGIYSIGSVFMFALFISIYSSHLFTALQKYRAQLQHFLTEVLIHQTMSFSEIHALFLSSLTVFIVAYLIYNIPFKPFLKRFKTTAKLFALPAQMNKNQTKDARNVI
ncbi:MAG: hypothetical protein M3388_11205 [Acidobacteriota bacterium]|nr:hypothetical protein [Acidobacteriota bacterium]